MELDWFQVAAALIGVEAGVLHLGLLGVGAALLTAALWPKRELQPRSNPNAAASRPSLRA